MQAIAPVDGRSETSDGLSLHFLAWRTASPRAVLVLVHGLAEHSGRYLHVGSHFAAAGYAVYAPDLRGHGKSPGPRVHVATFDEYLDDLAALRALAGRDYPATPVFLVGHSQGGLVALRYALAQPREVAGLILSSPLLGFHPKARASPALAALARVLSVLWPSVLLPNHVDTSAVSRDPEVVRRYREDPLVSGTVSPRWFTSVTSAMRQAHEGAPALAVPTLLMASGADRLADPDASARFAARAPASTLQYVRWDGLYHEMFNEPEQETVFSRMDAWLDDRLRASVHRSQ
jgi:acylglycerol lipase